MDANKRLDTYKSKRNFAITPEPEDGGEASKLYQFVVQKHWASSLHYDFRLELNGVMKSWAVPKGPSYDTSVKRMAVHVEDHPIAYASFEGTIPAKQYGAGKVIVWDKGYWRPLGDPNIAYANGNLKFELFGLKLHGKWVLVRMKSKGEKQEAWLLIKEKDNLAKSANEFSVVDEFPESVSDKPLPEHVLLVKTNIAHNQIEPTVEILKKAVKANLPDNLKPQLATLAEAFLFKASDWFYEIKFDGYRMLVRIEKDIKFFTRNGNDWTNKLPFLKEEFTKLNLPSGWYDGEIVVQDDKGAPDFGALQKSFDENKSDQIVLYVFDIVYISGHDLRELTLVNRRNILTNLFVNINSDRVRLSEVFNEHLESLLKSACKLGLEGIIAKRANSPYTSKRTDDWLKLKCKKNQEFIIIGYTPPNGLRYGFGALLLGIHDANGGLIHVGNVGSGFTKKTLTDIKHKLDAIQLPKPSTSQPFKAPSKTTWVKPILIAEVEFGDWTLGGHIRHSVFKGLKIDKEPKTITRELSNNKIVTNQALKIKNEIIITNPNRVIEEANGITKLELVRYYQLVGDLMMPHLKQRPVSFLRAPSGIAGELFFQKHADTEKLIGVKKIEQTDNKSPLIEISKKEGLASAAQWNVIEFHTHNGNLSLDLPDRIIFDLDPGENVQWQQVQEAGQLVHAFLTQLKLTSYLKTSGGKGLHIVVPIHKKYDWDAVKDFSQAVVFHMSKTIPSRFVAKSGPKNRVGKIFIDYLRNTQEATTVCAWSLRARAGLGISVPVDWSELNMLKGGDHWTLRTVHTRLDKGNEPWAKYKASANNIADAIAMLKTE